MQHGNPDPLPRGVERATVDALRRRDRSARELVDVLRAKGFSEDEAQAALNWARKQRYLDEGRAIELAQTRAEQQGRGPEWLRAFLESRGYPQKRVDDAVAQAEKEAGPRARVLVNQRFVPLDPQRARAYRFLISRGFSTACAREAVEAD